MRSIYDSDDRNRKVAYGVALMLLLPIIFMALGDRLSQKSTLISPAKAMTAGTTVVSEAYVGKTVSTAELVTAPEKQNELSADERTLMGISRTNGR